MKRSQAESLGQPIRAKFFAAALTGLGPLKKDVGPCLAISKALSQCMLSEEVVEIFEIDEETPSSVLHCMDKLQLNPAKINPRGGSISWGECPAVVGLRQAMSGLREARATGRKLVITATSANVGRGMAGIWVNEMGV